LEKDNETFTDNTTKADILNDQFSSVFTIDNTGADSILSLDGPSFPDIPSIQIETDGVYHLLQELNPLKASVPDGISARFLKETSTSHYLYIQSLTCSSQTSTGLEKCFCHPCL